jgi:hypothetical protein
VLPWVQDGPAEQLREVGRQLAAGSGHPRENAYRTGVIAADLQLPPRTLSAPPATPHEEALAALLSGEADFVRRPGWLWPLGLALGAGLLLASGRRRRAGLLAALAVVVVG